MSAVCTGGNSTQPQGSSVLCSEVALGTLALGQTSLSGHTTEVSTSPTSVVPWAWTEESADLPIKHLRTVSAALAELGPGCSCEEGRGCDWALGVLPALGAGPAPVRRGPSGLRGSCQERRP